MTVAALACSAARRRPRRRGRRRRRRPGEPHTPQLRPRLAAHSHSSLPNPLPHFRTSSSRNSSSRWVPRRATSSSSATASPSAPAAPSRASLAPSDSDVSLFERLLRGGVEHASLTAQRRLPPAITRLLLPGTPPSPTTRRRSAAPPSPASSAPSSFLAHERPEGLDPETGSRTNAHEAKFVAALAAYLLRQGYAPPQLAVVSPYCGQRRLIKQCLAEAGAAEVRAASVDHIDEADVVLLSLVRSNDGAKLGLLEEELLACRAVSRARGSGSTSSGTRVPQRHFLPPRCASARGLVRGRGCSRRSSRPTRRL